MNEITFWLYLGNRILTVIRLPAMTPDEEVRKQAILSHRRVPISHLDIPMCNPGEFECMLKCSEVKV